MQITFKKPIILAGATHESITLREPTVSDVLSSAKNLAESSTMAAFNDAYIDLVVRSAKVHPDLVKQMKHSDMQRATKYLDSFPLFEMFDVGDFTTDDDEVMIPLVNPVTDAKTTISEITVQEPTAAQVRDSNVELTANATLAQVMKRNVKLLASVSGVEPRVIERLPISVFRECEKVLSYFLEGSPETTER